MRILTSTNFARARKFILTEGRNLERAFFRYQFENGPKEDVLAALQAYQNADGGFGRALEPDIRTQASSAIATQHALETLRALLPVQDEMISRVVEYLVRTFDDNRAVWPIVPPQVEDALHAPWWTYATAEEGFGGYRANPTAAIAGLLQDHRSLFPDDILQQSIAQALDYLSSLPAEGVPIHDFLCFITLAESLEDVRKQIVLDKLALAIPHTIAFDMADWESYGLRPIAVA
ncbi:MAG: hypothetical protein ACK2T3_09790, partial [Candidatus Promineifilaceae bacterium]